LEFYTFFTGLGIHRINRYTSTLLPRPPRLYRPMHNRPLSKTTFSTIYPSISVAKLL